MTRLGRLALLVRIGAGFTLLGNLLVVSLKFHDSAWKYYVYVFPANLGVGILYPSILFTFLPAFEHKGELLVSFLGFVALLMVADQATSTSTVYLIRSIGWVWGVAIVSTIVQRMLRAKLPSALQGVQDKEQVANCLHPLCYADPDRSLKTSDIRFVLFDCYRLRYRNWRRWCIMMDLEHPLALLLHLHSSPLSPRSLRVERVCRETSDVQLEEMENNELVAPNSRR